VNVLIAPGKRLFLTGDEAVARAALELGVQVVTGYPGNPSTKTITALIPIARQYGMTVEWSVNEKVALEVATGAAWAGQRSLVTMKMSGMNVMADSLLSIAHSGVTGALVIYTVDDVGTYYGMVEQDSRHYALLASLPLLMPASPEEAYSMTRLAFTVSEQTGAPVIILSTTAVANAITAMKVGKIERDTGERPASFQRNLAKFTKAVPQWCRDQHADAILRLEHAGKLFNLAREINLIFTPEQHDHYKENKHPGVIVAGVSYTYLQELRQRSPEDFSEVVIFKVGAVYPLPQQELRDFLKEVATVLVLEELEPLIETQVLALIAEAGLHVKVLGKRSGLLPRVGDYSLELVEQAIAKLTERVNIEATGSLGDYLPPRHGSSTLAGARPPQTVTAPQRSLEFCPGCPHRMTYYALNRAIERLGFTQDDVITTGDIGCTIIGMNAPLDACWTEVSMGASIGIAQGFKYAGIERPVLAAMGDGTFYHNGIGGLLNAVQSGVNLTLIVLDNSRSAMTGMQPDPGTGQRADGEPSIRADIAMIARGCGVEYVRRLNPYHLPKMIETLQEAMKYPGVSVVIAEAPCTTQGVLIHERPVQVDQDACMAGRGCENTPCYHKVGCPAVLLSLDDVRPRLSIDTATCVACGLCVDACPFDAIKPIPDSEQMQQDIRSTVAVTTPLRSYIED
jgi:indolepyruvate ferredoxin oxidoreductase alpha subunit